MKRYLAMLGMAVILALPVTAGTEVNDEAHIAVQRTSDAGRLAELLARKGVITEQELAQVSIPAPATPAKTDQESASSNPYLENGLNW